ncbi:hypothetical protein [Mycolicibacterium llatzerense]|uniref:hypothetical protein n=1 Tax=Mycolicibacterium llatzerense TaxID=280871 RepID=UPI0021B5D605|nr:hypothetical protein [Mycolicibacterium llatzerense]MCT7372713.1 hypothetical protein [Mycolicibacterium llatzerense]
MKLPGINLNPEDLNPVHCCVCVNVGNMSVKAETLVKGYAVCAAHSVRLDDSASLRECIEAIVKAWDNPTTVVDIRGV